jgi:hypothetical protein
MHLSSTLSLEIELSIEGEYAPGLRATHNDPGHPESIEDLNITDIALMRHSRVDGKTTWTAKSIFNGVNLSSPDVQRLITNILNDADVFEDAANQLLAECEGD